MRHDAEVSHDAAPLLPALSILFSARAPARWSIRSCGCEW